LDVAALRTPAGIGKTYTTVKTVGAGQGTMGTNALVETHTTTESDAMGVHVRLRGIKDLPLLESEEIKGEYSGIGAGNRLAALIEIGLRPQRYTLLTLGGGWQQPIIGVNPTINIGTPSVNLGVVPGTGRRPFGSVGSVYDDPVRNVSNWETLWVQATLEFNPGQGWFYKYRPALVQGWNFNDQLKTPFSSAISLRMFNHPTGTDQGIFYNASGTVVTEGPASSGKLPTNGWLYEVNDITTLAVFETTQVWAEVGMGQQIAGLSASNAVVPANAYFNSALNVRHKQLTVGAGYAEDVYGPDDWYRTFGIVIDSRSPALVLVLMLVPSATRRPVVVICQGRILS
jgi:hypothetical protein